MKKSTIAFAVLLLLFAVAAGSTLRGLDESALAVQKGAQNNYEKLLIDFDLTHKMEDYGVPGISFGVIENGTLVWAKGYGVQQAGGSDPIDTETVFSVGSISKVGTAVLALKLGDEGLLSVDQDVNEYLTSWKIPSNHFTKEKAVTLRHIMSHTGGLTVHGFADFNPNETLPSTVQILNGTYPAKNSPVTVNIPIGSQFRYSGGGTTVTQMIIEDLTNHPFHQAAYSLLFAPLQMNRSSYQNPLPTNFGNTAKAHNSQGKPVALPRGYQSMPEAAASGLWTTPSDFSRLMIMLMEAYSKDGQYLKTNTVVDMMKPVAPGNYGMGPRIRREGQKLKFSHGGANDSYRAHFIGEIQRKNGLIIFTNGREGDELIDILIPLFEPLLFQTN